MDTSRLVKREVAKEKANDDLYVRLYTKETTKACIGCQGKDLEVERTQPTCTPGICSGWMGTMWALAQNGFFVWVPLGFLTLNQYGQSKVGTYSRSLLGQRWEILNLVGNGKDTFTDSLGSVEAHSVSDFPNITPI